ncbi:uncharacterized protein LOC103767233 [Manacus vitellinus]|uniref:uncharacterized protein LOC103767233 n=1 Tax=Manacus vitellinus TaxID=328815 RepID=UPI00084644D9|nr:uncharacterized protein LOC103767233 [Manacus vitellinus]
MEGFPALLLLLALPGSSEFVSLFAKEKGTPLPHHSLSVQDNTRKLQCCIWCKMVSQIQGNSDQSLLKAGGTGMMNEFSWKMIRVQLRKLQLNDSGEYQLETYFQGRNKPRNSTKLEVLEEYRSLGTDSDPITFATEKGDIATDDTNKEQSSLHALVVLSSFLPTTALVAAVLFLLTTYIRTKRAGKGMDTGKHPAFRQRALQLRGHKGSGMAEGELSRSTVYAVIRPQQQPRPEDVLYANVQPAPKLFFHLQEPPGSSASSGPVEYATVLFRTTAPHPDTATEENSFT